MGNVWRAWKLLLRHLRSRFEGEVWMWAGLLVLTPITEGFGVLLILPLFQAIGLRAEGEAEPPPGFLEALGVADSLLAVLGLLLAAILLHESVKWFQVRKHARLHLSFVAGFREDLFRAMAHARWETLGGLKTSTLHKTITEDVDRAFGTLTATEGLLLTLVMSSAYLAMALWISPGLTLLVAVASASYFVLVQRPVGRMDKLGQRVAETYGEMYGTIGEYLTFIRTFKSYGMVDDAVRRFEASSREIAEIHVKEVDIRTNLEIIYKVIGAIGLCGFIYVALGIFALPASSFFFLALVLSRAALSVPGIVGAGLEISINAPSLREALALIEKCEKEREPRLPPRRRDFQGPVEVRLDEVSFAYIPGTPVLDHLSLAIPKQRTTAIIGPSGTGKSTILDILVGLLEPQEGSIWLDGAVATSPDLMSLRAATAYVGQEMFLFHGTVRENLRWGAEDATNAEVQEALTAAHALAFVDALPAGLDTIVGDRGVLLSSGQRQRLAIARALLRRPRFLILDEPTSALDTESENQIVRTMEELRGSTTIVIVSHRLNAIRSADTVYTLDEGSARALGTGAEVHERLSGLFIT